MLRHTVKIIDPRVKSQARSRAVGTGGAQGHLPPQYLDQLVVVPLQYFGEISVLNKWVPPQYLTPSYGPDATTYLCLTTMIIEREHDKKSFQTKKKDNMCKMQTCLEFDNCNHLLNSLLLYLWAKRENELCRIVDYKVRLYDLDQIHN